MSSPHVWLATVLVLCVPVLSQNTGFCTKPGVSNGRCILIKECQPALEVLTKSPRTQDDLKYIQNLHCGFEGNNPKVCCPVTETVGDRIEDYSKVSAQKLMPLRTVCGISSEDRIFGGSATEIDEFPWMALLNYEKADGKREFACGGTLINQRYILTAAHCVKYASTKRLKLVSVRLGEYDTKTPVDCIKYDLIEDEVCADPPMDVLVEEIIPHEGYSPTDPNQYDDIALVRLAEDIRYTDYIKPICLPMEVTSKFVGASLTACGWGVTENNTNSQVKLKVQVPVTSNEKCNEIYKPTTNVIKEKQLCAGGSKGKDTCKGDSGGPLMNYSVKKSANWEQVGVVSYGRFPCGIDGWPGVYTRVDQYIDWILSKIRK